MEELTLRKAHLLARKLYIQLTEVQDYSRQLAEALDRNDQVTAQMLIGMRSEPVRNAQQAKTALGALRNELTPTDAARLTALLNGAEAENEGEHAFAAQLRSNEKLLQQVLTMDEVLNRKIARDKSIYQNKRPSAR